MEPQNQNQPNAVQNVTPAATNSASTSNVNKTNNIKKIIIGSVFVLLVVMSGIILLLRSSHVTKQAVKIEAPIPVSVVGPNKIIAKVGKEYIYQKDLSYELAKYPDIPGVDAKKILLQKLIDDSIALQAASQNEKSTITNQLISASSLPQSIPEGEKKLLTQKIMDSITTLQSDSYAERKTAIDAIVNSSLSASSTSQSEKNTLSQALTNNFTKIVSAPALTIAAANTTVFNSSQKDYTQRMQVMDQVRTQYAQPVGNIQGGIVALWFFNTKPAAIGYDQGKALALAKITTLHDAVKSGRMTIQQAGDAIKNDSSLASVDSAYKENAYLPFNVSMTEPIIFDPNFDAIIKKLSPGQTADVYLAKDTDPSTGQKVDAVYVFGQVTSQGSVNSSSTAYSDWVTAQSKNYEVTYY